MKLVRSRLNYKHIRPSPRQRIKRNKNKLGTPHRFHLGTVLVLSKISLKRIHLSSSISTTIPEQAGSGTPLPSDSRVTIDCPWHRNESMTLLPPGQSRQAGQQKSSCRTGTDLGHIRALPETRRGVPGKSRGLTVQFRWPRQRGWSRRMPRRRCS